MDLLSLARLLWRRRWVTALASVIAIVMVSVAVVSAPPAYRASASMVLLSPPTPPPALAESPRPSVVRRVQNPYVRFNDLSIVVDILRRVMTSEPTERALETQGLAGEYSVAANVDFSRGPIIDVAVEADSQAAAIAGAQLVVDETSTTLAQLQTDRGIDDDYFITTEVVVEATRGTQVLSSAIRRGIAASAVGVLFVLGAVVVADALATRRARRRGDQPVSAGAPPPPVGPTAWADAGGSAAHVAARSDHEADEFDPDHRPELVQP